jgi:hypothetical protein
VSSRKEQKEALRREREAREAAAREADRRKRMLGYGVGGALAVGVVAVLAVLLLAGGNGGGGKAAEVFPDGGEVPEQKTESLRAAVRDAGCKLQRTPAKSRDHIADSSERVKYPTNPPDSGRHFQVPADDGLYGKAPTDEQLVHSLEHGRMLIWVKPTLPRSARADLRAFFDDDEYQMIMVPRGRMPSAVAASAWTADPAPLGTGHLLTCPRYDDGVFDALRTFREEYRGNGPEPVP